MHVDEDGLRKSEICLPSQARRRAIQTRMNDYFPTRFESNRMIFSEAKLLSEPLRFGRNWQRRKAREYLYNNIAENEIK